MDHNFETMAPNREEVYPGPTEDDDDGGSGAAVAFVLALSSFVAVVTLVLLRHVLFKI